MTRRTAMLMGLGLPAVFPLFGAAREFWNERQPAEWTDDEREILLTRSPWAKEASVDFNAGGGLGTSRSTRTGGGMNRRGGGTPVPQDSART